jgi:metal binding Ada-like protein
MRSYRVIAAAALAWSLTGLAARAQTPPPAPSAPPAAAPSTAPKHGSSHKHSKGPAGSQTPIPGGIIGNKSTHVYHLPGDKSNMPSEKNRVYFHNEAEARAAGYHAAKKGGKHSTTHSHPPKSGHGAPPTPPAPGAPSSPPSGR